MLLTELILSKRGPLAKVWLSAHHERKLSKQQALGVDVEESVDAILTQEDGPITLRLSGQLMLGVTRIYSRKVQYLLDDCKETRERITLAFRPGIVDLPEDQIRASKNAITLPDVRNDFDFFDWSWVPPPADIAPRGLHTAPAAQINLRPAQREYGAYNFGRPAAPSIYGGSTTSRHSSPDLHDSNSQDFSGIDLNLRLEDFGAGDDSVEIGREAQPGLSREGSVRSGFEKRGGSLDVPEGMAEFEPMDLGLDFGELEQPVPNLEERSRRESSALSTPPPLSPLSITDITPRTAARVATLADARTQRDTAGKPKRPRQLQADEELELPDDDFAAPNRNNSNILGVERYIPAVAEIIRLREIVADPVAYFLPSVRVGPATMIYAGPQGLAPELADLFAFPSDILRRDRSTSAERSPKRPRIEGPADGEDEVELGRRGSMAPASEGFPDPFAQAGDDTFDLGVETGVQPDIPLVEEEITPRAKRVRESSLAPSRAESIARAIHFGEEEAGAHPLAMFDSRQQREGESQVSITPTKSLVSEARSKTSSGYSRNTAMAIGLLRQEIEAIEEEDKVIQFDRIADKTTRRGASAFFFELLVLGSRDCVKLEQPRAFEDISIRGKDKLWEEISA